MLLQILQNLEPTDIAERLDCFFQIFHDPSIAHPNFLFYPSAEPFHTEFISPAQHRRLRCGCLSRAFHRLEPCLKRLEFVFLTMFAPTLPRQLLLLVCNTPKTCFGDALKLASAEADSASKKTATVPRAEHPAEALRGDSEIRGSDVRSVLSHPP